MHIGSFLLMKMLFLFSIIITLVTATNSLVSQKYLSHSYDPPILLFQFSLHFLCLQNFSVFRSFSQDLSSFSAINVLILWQYFKLRSFRNYFCVQHQSPLSFYNNSFFPIFLFYCSSLLAALFEQFARCLSFNHGYTDKIAQFCKSGIMVVVFTEPRLTTCDYLHNDWYNQACFQIRIRCFWV